MYVILNILRKGAALFFAWLVLVLNAAESPPKEGYYEPVSTQTFVLLDALFRAQGMTTDGEHFFFSSNYGLLKTELDCETIVCQKLIAIPQELLDLGCKHIGGITYYDGKLYCPIEDSKVFEHLYICTFDSETLEFIKAYPLPLELHENGVPWCVADPERGVIYSARRDYPEVLNVYDAETMEPLAPITLTDTPHKVQGGEMYDGILYLSVSRGAQSVFAINPATGEVQLAFERNLFEGSEGEGMTILPTEDGALFHVMDICSIKLATHVRHYAFDPDTIEWEITNQ